jgi:hypothetical protein
MTFNEMMKKNEVLHTANTHFHPLEKSVQHDARCYATGYGVVMLKRFYVIVCALLRVSFLRFSREKRNGRKKEEKIFFFSFRDILGRK